MLSKSNSNTVLRRIISSIVLGAFLINTIFSEVSLAAPVDLSAQTLSQAAVTLDPQRAVSLLAESYRSQNLLWTPKAPKYDDLLTRYGADALLLPAGKYLVKPELLSETSDFLLVRAITLEDFKVLLSREWRDHEIRLAALKDRIIGDQSIISAYCKLPLSKALSGHDPRVIFNDIITRSFEIRALITGHLIQAESNPLSNAEMNFYAALKDTLEEEEPPGTYANFSGVFYDNSERMRSVLGIRKPKSSVIAGAIAAGPEKKTLDDNATEAYDIAQEELKFINEAGPQDSAHAVDGTPGNLPSDRKITKTILAVLLAVALPALAWTADFFNTRPGRISPEAATKTELATDMSGGPIVLSWTYTEYPSGRIESKRADTPDEYDKVYYHFIDEDYYGRGYGRVDVDVLATNDSSGVIAYSYEYDDAVSYDVEIGDGSTRITNGVTHVFVGFGGASYTSIQAAVDEAYDAHGGTVIVSGGTYNLNNSHITLKDGVRMMGGYAQDGTRDITASPTVLEGGYIDAIGPVTQDTEINGFTIDSGTHARRHLIGADTRGGTGRILIMNNTLRARTDAAFGIEVVGSVSQATIFNNDITAVDGGKFYWAGVHIADGAWVIMEFNRISTLYGAGVTVNGSIVPSKAVIRNNMFTDNGENPASKTHILLFDAFSSRVWDNTLLAADSAVISKDSEDTKVENNIASDQAGTAILRIGSALIEENGNVIGSGLDPADYPDKGYSPHRIYIDYDSRGYTKTGFTSADTTNPSNPILTNPVLSYEYDASGLFTKQTNYDGTYSLYVDHWQDTGNVKKRLNYSSTNELLSTTEYWTDGYSALSIINHVTGQIDEWLSGNIYRQLVPSNGTYHAYTYKDGNLILENDPVYGVKVFNYDTNWNVLGYTRYYDDSPTNGLGTRIREEYDSSWRLIKKYVWDKPFHAGVNLPWIDYGKDIGRSRALVSEPVQRGFSTKREELDENLRQLAGSVSRPFVLCDLRSGIRIDGSGNILGFDEQTSSDLRELLNSAQANGVKLILTIFDYTIAEGVICVEYDTWYGPVTEPLGEYPQFITDASKREQLKDAVLALFDKVEIGKYSCVIGFDLMNEPEFARDGLDYGAYSWNVYDPNWSGGVPQADLESFFDYFTDALKIAYPDKWITVGHKDREELSGWSGTNDLYQFHYYDWMASSSEHSPLDMVGADDLSLDGPIFAGELEPTNVTNKLRALYDGGYSMGLFWRDESDFPMSTNTLDTIKNYFIGTVYEYDGSNNITNTYHVDGEVIEPANKTASISGLIRFLFMSLGITLGLRQPSRNGSDAKPSDQIAGAMAEAGYRLDGAAALKGTNEMLWDWNFRIYMLVHKRGALKAAGRGTGNVKRSLATIARKMGSALPFVAEILSVRAVNKIRDAIRLVGESNEPAANMNLTSIFPEVMAKKAANIEKRIKTESRVERVFYRNGAWYVREQRHRYSDKWKTSVLVYIYQRYDTLWEAFRAVDHQIDSELGETQYLTQCRSIIDRINDPSFTDKSGLSQEIKNMQKRLGRVRIEEKKLARSLLMAASEIIKYGGTEQTAGLLRIACDLFEKRAKESDAIAAGLAEKRISVLRKELKRKNDYLLKKADKILHDLNFGNHGLTEMIISEDLRTPEGLRYMNEPDMAVLNRSLEVIAGRFVRGPPRETDMESLKRFFRLFHRRVIDSMVVGNLMVGYRDKFIEDYRKSGGDLAPARSKAFEETAKEIIAEDRNAKKDPEIYYKMFRQAAFLAPKIGKPGEKIPNPEFTAISDDVIRREAEKYGIKPQGVALLVSAPPAGSRNASDSIAGAMAEDGPLEESVVSAIGVSPSDASLNLFSAAFWVVDLSPQLVAVNTGQPLPTHLVIEIGVLAILIIAGLITGIVIWKNSVDPEYVAKIAKENEARAADARRREAALQDEKAEHERFLRIENRIKKYFDDPLISAALDIMEEEKLPESEDSEKKREELKEKERQAILNLGIDLNSMNPEQRKSVERLVREEVRRPVSSVEDHAGGLLDRAIQLASLRRQDKHEIRDGSETKPSDQIAGAMAEDGPLEESVVSAIGVSPSDAFLKALRAFEDISAIITDKNDTCALNTEVSKLGGAWQDLSADSAIRLVMPVEVLKDCSDIALAFKRLGLSGEASPKVKLVVTGASEDDAKLFEALNTSAGARQALGIPVNVSISVLRESEIAGESNDPHTVDVARLMGININDPEIRVGSIKKLALRREPLARGEYMAIVTSGVDSGRMHETVERLEESYLVEDNMSILLLEKPDPSKSAYSLSKMLRMWAADIRRGETSNIRIILSVLISPKEMLERLGTSLRTAWQILAAA